MMSRLHIEIERQRVVRLAAMESAYTAAKRADADELCDTVPMVEADDEMLEALWMKSCAQLQTFLRSHLRRNVGFLLSAHFDIHGFHACLVSHSVTHCVPACINGDELGQVIGTLMTAYLAKDMLAGWMSMALPEREPACRADAEQILLTLEQTFTTCRRPIRVRKRMEIL